MPAVIPLISKILLSPLWLLWRSYGVLWWAFNEDTRAETQRVPRPSSSMVVPNAANSVFGSIPTNNPDLPGPRTQRVAQDSAFEIIDSSPPQAKPTAALKLGFAVSLIASALLAWAFNYAAGHEAIRPSAQLPLWLWSSSMVFVGSLWPVRHIARRQQVAQPQGVRAHTLCIAGGMKDCTVSAFTTAKQVKNTTISAAATVSDGAKRLFRRSTGLPPGAVDP